jgi:hypothetical protein
VASNKRNPYEVKLYSSSLGSQFSVGRFSQSKWSSEDPVEVIDILSHQPMDIHTNNEAGEHIDGVVDLG